MEKRVRLLRGAGSSSFIQEMAGDRVVNNVFLMGRNEAAELWKDLGKRYGFMEEVANVFPNDLFRDTK